MEINKTARAGTLESSDLFVMVQPNEEGIDIELESLVIKQYGNHIKKIILEKLKEMGINNIKVTANDRGALDYTIKSRIETAVKRAL
jgi:citrate lyase subunit gamma (acyl carrier protein)